MVQYTTNGNGEGARKVANLYSIFSMSEDANWVADRYGMAWFGLLSWWACTPPLDPSLGNTDRIYNSDNTDTAHSYNSFAHVVTPIMFLECISPFAASNGDLLNYLLGNPIVPNVSVPIRKSNLPVCVGCRRRLSGCLGAHYIYPLSLLYRVDNNYLLTYLLTHLIPKANRLLYLLLYSLPIIRCDRWLG